MSKARVTNSSGLLWKVTSSDLEVVKRSRITSTIKLKIKGKKKVNGFSWNQRKISKLRLLEIREQFVEFDLASAF